MQRSATRFTNPNDRVGYGIPDMKKSFAILLKKSYTQQASVANCTANVLLNVKHDNTMNIIVEKKDASQNTYTSFKTILGTGSFTNKNVSFADDLSSIAGGLVIYRMRLDIATDTSFYLDSITVNFVAKPNFGADKVISKCNNSNVDLTTQFNTTGLTSVTWTTNGTPVVNPASVSNAGTFQLIASNASGCTDTALVVINANASINLGADKAVNKCSDSSVNLTTQFITTGLNTSWKINGSNVTNPNAVTAAGVYQLIVTNSFGCADTATIAVTNDPLLCPKTGITIGPNPVVDILEIEIFKAAPAKIDIVIQNMIGQRVYSMSNQQAAVPQMYKVPFGNKAAGAYYVSVFVNGKVELVKKVVKR
jgi:hypothetical protein